MKIKKIILFLTLAIVLFFNNSYDADASICCDRGCYPDANVCCGAQGQTVGVQGCFDPSNNQYHCPGEDFRLGQCLSCRESSQWVEDTEGLAGCNACVVEYDANNNPVGSTCDSSCPEGTTLCDDGMCRESCGVQIYSACSTG